MKTYLIDNVEMQLKDLSLDEADEVNSLLNIKNKTEIELTNDDSKRFLQLVLEPTKRTDKVIDFGKCKETTAVEVLQDFLLRKIERGEELKSSFTTSISGIMKRFEKQKP